MKRINILDTDTSNKIAAGEVVERPFSVVKELVENSLDAGSKNITIEINDGGQKSIKILDDGSGIHPEDIDKAFLPHSTSKISQIDDIYKINTFGFRGEALASISAVSRVKLRSKTKDFQYGKEINIAGGLVQNIEEVGCNEGTSIEVNELFYNVPARLKFMKSSQREAALINDIVERLALVNPEVSFKLYNNSSKVLTTHSSTNPFDAIRAIYGKSICENVIYFENHLDIVSIYGYVGNAEISRGSRNNQSIFINKRYIKNKLITTAVENAFKSFLTINKFPFFVLFIDIFPEFIDVNVHPTKAEIKFKDDRFIFKAVFDTVHEAIRRSMRESFSANTNIFDNENTGSNNLQASEPNLVQVPLDLKPESIYSVSKQSQMASSIYETNFEFDTSSSKSNFSDVDIDKSYPEKVVLSETAENSNNNIMPKFPQMSVIGQFNYTYIIAQALDDLYIIDQHAAHEKIIFEKYIKEVKNRAVLAQILASPTVLELSSDDFGLYNENIEIFNNAGFKIEIFGENTISIREVPIILGEIQVKNLFIDILDNIKDMGTGETSEVKYDKIAKLSCKSAVKANNKLSPLAMNALIEELRYINDPFTCPHGRPTIIKVTLNELEKRFKRIQ